MVEYDVCICYGMIISDEVAKQLQEWDEDFCDQYVRCVNSWTGDKGWFLGVTKSIGLADTPVMLLNSVHIPKFEINKLERTIYKNGLEERINWDPKYYIIEFCY